MNSVFWAALGIGGSTLIGTGCGFWISRVSDAWNDMVTSFAAGVMLAAACFGLFAPAMEMAQGWSLLLIAAGAACGAAFLRIISMISGKFHGSLLGRSPELMFVLAIAVHKFPEGMAGGVGLNAMDPAAAITIVAGIALQNLPEGMVMIPPLIAAGVRRSRAACIALATGLLNAAGVYAGALWGQFSGGWMPFALAFAGGAMLDVIIGNMIPCASAGHGRHGPLVAMGGFLIMIMVNALF